MSSGNWAEISPDQVYRYALHRLWKDGPEPVLGWLMLNPSTADATINDPTVRKVIRISDREGYGGAWVANLYGLRTPSPVTLRGYAGDPVGPDCDTWLRTMLAAVPEVVVAWGAHGGQPWVAQRRDAVLSMVAESGVTVSCLGRTRDGEPRHPCRLANITPLETWTP